MILYKNITSTGDNSFSRSNTLRRTSFCSSSVSVSILSSSSSIFSTMATSLPRKPTSSNSSNSLIAFAACAEAAKERFRKLMICGTISFGKRILRPNIMPAISSALFATRSCAASSSSKSLRETGKNIPLGKCKRISVFKVSASVSRAEICF